MRERKGDIKSAHIVKWEEQNEKEVQFCTPPRSGPFLPPVSYENLVARMSGHGTLTACPTAMTAVFQPFALTGAKILGFSVE